MSPQKGPHKKIFYGYLLPAPRAAQPSQSEMVGWTFI